MGNKGYANYRGKRIPEWWKHYLPEEKNPYNKDDTLTLEKGCLSDFWHIHCSNKDRNYIGVESCNAVQKMIHDEFGGAFLAPANWHWAGHQGQKEYDDDNHLIYRYAHLDNKHIHIEKAWQYYEDVVSFMLNILQMISSNHIQSGADYYASDFFPYYTDREIEIRNLVYS